MWNHMVHALAQIMACCCMKTSICARFAKSLCNSLTLSKIFTFVTPLFVKKKYNQIARCIWISMSQTKSHGQKTFIKHQMLAPKECTCVRSFFQKLVITKHHGVFKTKFFHVDHLTLSEPSCTTFSIETTNHFLGCHCSHQTDSDKCSILVKIFVL